MDEAQLRDRIDSQAAQLGVDALFSEKGHYADARAWRFWHRGLGLPSAALAAIAGGAFLSELFLPIVPAMIAFSSAILTGVSSFLEPEQKAARHHQTGVAYGALRRRIRHFVQVQCKRDDLSVAQLSDGLDLLTRDINTLHADAPPISRGGFQNAGKQIKAGTADYTPAELAAAVGRRAGQV
ncbi:SLATT domain-containing protein [Brevundimonas sp.]|uniref:SLATT domain-containing protein n=1 Tax=Brevundimonas sp. TaxID=1871086 RepID=UPI00286CC846|nr:SLATT domain-containing protein [Brevundimonas sp.]